MGATIRFVLAIFFCFIIQYILYHIFKIIDIITGYDFNWNEYNTVRMAIIAVSLSLCCVRSFKSSMEPAIVYNLISIFNLFNLMIFHFSLSVSLKKNE